MSKIHEISFVNREWKYSLLHWFQRTHHKPWRPTVHAVEVIIIGSPNPELQPPFDKFQYILDDERPDRYENKAIEYWNVSLQFIGFASMRNAAKNTANIRFVPLFKSGNQLKNAMQIFRKSPNANFFLDFRSASSHSSSLIIKSLPLTVFFPTAFIK